METPATGMWGSGDFGPEFWPMDWLVQECASRHADPIMRKASGIEWMRRAAIRDAILDLAEDLDARGLVVAQEAVFDRAIEIIEASRPKPSSPSTGS